MTLDDEQVDAYLKRIGIADRPTTVDADTLETLMRAHLTAVAFENIDVYNGTPVHTDPARSFDKVVTRGRGGWCFELNGSFAILLEALGFPVLRLGAAVLLGGPTTVVDHLTLEVNLDQAYLVDVGFGDSFCRPLLLNRRGAQDGGTDTFEFMPSPEGVTLVRNDDDGVPRPQYRFRRVGLTMGDLDGASQRLQADKTMNWHQRAFATRYLDGGPDRVTLMGNDLKLDRGGQRTESEVGDDRWPDVLAEWFDMAAPLDGPAVRNGDG
jgi:N-hydroxyarylamine O-acetyltransferase